jgi:very-short-patch-repair endonuclease
MLKYNAQVKGNARQLRKNLTDSEAALWSRLRRKQILGVQFYRQKPIGRHIVDFFAPRPRLVVEVDGGQHLEGDHTLKDRTRDGDLVALGLRALRFSSRDVLKETNAVVEVIYRTVAEQLNAETPPSVLSPRGRSSLPFPLFDSLMEGSRKSPRPPLSQRGAGGILGEWGGEDLVGE